MPTRSPGGSGVESATHLWAPPGPRQVPRGDGSCHRRNAPAESRCLAATNRDRPGQVQSELSHETNQDAEDPGKPSRQGGARLLDQSRPKGDDSQQDERKPGGNGTGDHDAERPEDEQRDPQLLGKSVELAGKLQV